MGDVFIEYLVKRKNTSAILLAQVGTGVAAALVVTVLLAFSTVSGMFMTPCILAAAGAVYGAYRLIIRFDVEFEYTVTNGELDVDRIIAKRKRARLASIKCRDAEEFGRYDAKNPQGKVYAGKIVACADINAGDVWYIAARTGEKGLTLVIFSANDRILNAIKPFLPRQLASGAFKETK